MANSVHRFRPDPDRPRDCAVCGRRSDAHLPPDGRRAVPVLDGMPWPVPHLQDGRLVCAPACGHGLDHQCICGLETE
jgi:hypothetical protein